MSIKRTLQFLMSHPIGSKNKAETLKRFFRWQLSTRLTPYPVLPPFVGGAKLLVSRGMTRATGNIYTGLHEFNDMAFLLHFLRNSDQFIDVGSNIGSYTLLGAKEVGANTIAIEPIPATFDILETNIMLNKVQSNVKALNIGLGAEPGKL